MAGTPTIDKLAEKVKIPRASARLRVESLMYLDLGSENGGFPINISEEGMAFQGIRPLERDQELCITFQLDGISEPVTAIARVVWLTESRKAGALQFVDMPEASRSQIRDWIELQRKAESPQHSAELKITPFKTKMGPIAPGVSATPVLRVAPPAAASKDAVPPALELPAAGPVPSTPSLPPGAAAQAQPKVTAVRHNEEPGTKRMNQSAQAVPASANPQRSITVTAPPRKKKSGRTMSYTVGLAASFGIAIACGAILWPHRASLLNRFHTDNRAKAISPSAPKAARPLEDTPAVEPPGDLPMKDPSQWSSMGNGLKAPSSPAPRDISVSAPVNLANGSRVPPPLIHGKPSNAPVVSASAVRLQSSPAAPANSRPPAPAVTALPIAGNVNEVPGTASAGGKTEPLETKAPASPVTPAGSVEIISDPYPSIRMTTGAQGPASRLGTSLQIGRLASKIDPVYPQEALRQKVTGTVKLHLVIAKTGAVQSAELVDGPEPLAGAAVRAVEQWRYDPTMLGGSAIEVEEGVTLVFRMPNSPSPAN
jgi:TonB family protein